MNQRDFLLTKINSGKGELEQMPVFMKMERELLQADIKEWEEELAKIPPGPNGEKIYFLTRQINAAKDYLRRLHPRFEEERKQREEFIQEKEAELKELEKENVAKSPQLEPCPFCGSMPVEYNGCIRCEAPDCYVQPGVKSEMPEFLPKLWNQMAMIDCEDEKQESDKFHQPYLNPCVRCGGLGLIEGDSTERRAWCYRCDNEIIIKGKSTEKQIIDAWNEENPILNPCVKCGFPAKRRNYPDTAMVYCPECMDSCVGRTMAEAVRKWNEKNTNEKGASASNPFKPCAKCGSPVEWEMSLSGRRGWVKCPRCGNEMTVDDEEYHTMEEWIEMWNQANTKPERRSEMPVGKDELNACARCGMVPDSPYMMFTSDDQVCISCENCHRTVFEMKRADAVADWNKLNPLKEEPLPFDSIGPAPEIPDPPEVPSTVTKQGDGGVTNVSGIWINKRPDEQPLMLLNKLDLLNAVLGLQRDEVGPVIRTKEIQESIIEIVKSIQERTCWENKEAIQNLEESIKEMESTPYLAPVEKEYVKVRGTVYVTALHIARAICREAELYAWEWEQRKGITMISLIPEYLNRLGDWLFIMAEYLRETEECF